jgi:hypothetical protein
MHNEHDERRNCYAGGRHGLKRQQGTCSAKPEEDEAQKNIENLEPIPPRFVFWSEQIKTIDEELQITEASERQSWDWRFTFIAIIRRKKGPVICVLWNSLVLCGGIVSYPRVVISRRSLRTSASWFGSFATPYA